MTWSLRLGLISPFIISEALLRMLSMMGSNTAELCGNCGGVSTRYASCTWPSPSSISFVVENVDDVANTHSFIVLFVVSSRIKRPDVDENGALANASTIPYRYLDELSPRRL
jgi:hypothetical protein